MKKKLRRITKQYILVGVISLLVVGGAAVFTTYTITNSVKTSYQSKLDHANLEIEENKREAYVTTIDIAAGDYLTEENVEVGTFHSTQPQEYFITADDMGKVAKINLGEGTQILSSMVSEHILDENIRESAYGMIRMNSNISINDVVDVRIMFPNGENFIVLSKKNLKNFDADNYSSFLWVDEEEILRMSAAIVDAGLYGADIYATKYIEPTIQSDSVVTYTPNAEIIDLIRDNPNIVKITSDKLSKILREELNDRLDLFLKENEGKEILNNDDKKGNIKSDEVETDSEKEDERGETFYED